MRTLFQRLFSPSEEPSNDPRVLIDATLAAERRLKRYEAERAIRMAEYERAWKPEPVAERSPVLVWVREAR